MYKKMQSRWLRFPTFARIVLSLYFYAAFSCVSGVNAFAGQDKTAILMNQLEQQLIRALKGQGIGGNLRIELIGEQQDIFKAFYYGEADLQEVQVSNINTNNGYFSAVAEIIPHTAQHSISIQLQGQYEDVVEIPVLKNKTMKGNVIAENDITMMERPSRLVKGDVITKKEALVGKMTKNAIFSGKPISARAVSEPVLIKKGRHVTVVYDTPSIHLRTIGVALEDGEQNALIAIKNISSGTVVHAEVSGPNEAKIPVIAGEGGNSDTY